MLVNPFSDFQVQNNLDDFKMPYQLYGREDYEYMKIRYLKLRNNSYGYVVRFTTQIK